MSAAKLTKPQVRLLAAVREATDCESRFHRSGAANAPGMVVRGASIRALERRGLVKFDGFGMEVDGDGFAVTGDDDAPVYVITDAGRAALTGGAAPDGRGKAE